MQILAACGGEAFAHTADITDRASVDQGAVNLTGVASPETPMSIPAQTPPQKEIHRAGCDLGKNQCAGSWPLVSFWLVR